MDIATVSLVLSCITCALGAVVVGVWIWEFINWLRKHRKGI